MLRGSVMPAIASPDTGTSCCRRPGGLTIGQRRAETLTMH
jgi:hypothetical protein